MLETLVLCQLGGLQMSDLLKSVNVCVVRVWLVDDSLWMWMIAIVSLLLLRCVYVMRAFIEDVNCFYSIWDEISLVSADASWVFGFNTVFFLISLSALCSSWLKTKLLYMSRLRIFQSELQPQDSAGAEETKVACGLGSLYKQSHTLRRLYSQ